MPIKYLLKYPTGNTRGLRCGLFRHVMFSLGSDAVLTWFPKHCSIRSLVPGGHHTTLKRVTTRVQTPSHPHTATANSLSYRNTISRLPCSLRCCMSIRRSSSSFLSRSKKTGYGSFIRSFAGRKIQVTKGLGSVSGSGQSNTGKKELHRRQKVGAKGSRARSLDNLLQSFSGKDSCRATRTGIVSLE